MESWYTTFCIGFSRTNLLRLLINRPNKINLLDYEGIFIKKKKGSLKPIQFLRTLILLIIHY